jgi:hypothetical protein
MQLATLFNLVVDMSAVKLPGEAKQNNLTSRMWTTDWHGWRHTVVDLCRSTDGNRFYSKK